MQCVDFDLEIELQWYYCIGTVTNFKGRVTEVMSRSMIRKTRIIQIQNHHVLVLTCSDVVKSVQVWTLDRRN